MSVQAMWIRNNMLYSEQYERQLTDAELKVQRCLESLSIPEWYLNKRSSPPKILNNTPVEYRLPSWKNDYSKRTSVTDATGLAASPSKSTKTSELSNSTTGTYKIQRQSSADINQKKNSPSSTSTEKMDTNIPDVEPKRDISKTFPKMSPSRKLQNINLILPRESPLNLSIDFEEDRITEPCNYDTFIIIKRNKPAANKTKNEALAKEEEGCSCPKPPNQRYEDQNPPLAPISSPRTPDRCATFRVRGSSTPKHSRESLFSSTILEESPKVRKPPSKSILEKLSIFEDSWKDSSMVEDTETASRSLQNGTPTLKSHWKEKPQSVSFEGTPSATQRLRSLLAKSIRSIEPIVFESRDFPKPSVSVKEIVRKVEDIRIDENTPVRRSSLQWRKPTFPEERKTSRELEEGGKEAPSERSLGARRMSMGPEDSRSPGEALELKHKESPIRRSQNPRRMSIVPEDFRNASESLKTLLQQEKVNEELEEEGKEAPSERSLGSRRMSITPEDSRSPGEALELKHKESPIRRSQNPRRMSIVPEQWKNIGDSWKTPVQQPTKDKESPISRSLNSRRMSLVSEELKDLAESSQTPTKQTKDKEYPNARPLMNPRRLSLVSEELKDLVDSAKTPTKRMQGIESPSPRNPRRMSLIPEELKDLVESSKTPVQLKKKDADSPKPSHPRRLSLVSEELNLVGSSKTPVPQRDEPEAPVDSPSTRFLTSKRKSIELENVVRSKQSPKRKSVVRGIIEAFISKATSESTLSRQSSVRGVHQNFVRTMVKALEKGSLSPLEETVQESVTSTVRNEEDDLESCSESDVKSCATTLSPKDTDSSSDTDQRSPLLLESDDCSHRTFDFDRSMDASSRTIPEQKHGRDEDSVYWIPVSRCKLPRTSSLLSMMSKLSTTSNPSPCISPIRSDSENEQHSPAPWGATYRKAHALSRKLFRIDETIVIDSGYSDKSDRSAVGYSMTDSNWSEDTQYESGTEVSINRNRKVCRRRSGIGATFRVSH